MNFNLGYYEKIFILYKIYMQCSSITVFRIGLKPLKCRWFKKYLIEFRAIYVIKMNKYHEYIHLNECEHFAWIWLLNGLKLYLLFFLLNILKFYRFCIHKYSRVVYKINMTTDVACLLINLIRNIIFYRHLLISKNFNIFRFDMHFEFFFKWERYYI